MGSKPSRPNKDALAPAEQGAVTSFVPNGPMNTQQFEAFEEGRLKLLETIEKKKEEIEKLE